MKKYKVKYYFFKMYTEKTVNDDEFHALILNKNVDIISVKELI